MNNVWAFPPEVNRQADFIKHIVIENIRLRDENARLKEERRWIPVSERLPEDRSWAIVKTTDFTEPLAVLAQYCNGNWWWFEWRELQLTVTHWMPLPEPPQEVEG